ncbi:GNAT family N-acetyltransferase [Psychrobacillus sp. PGGUH221]|uniref:GNAT family N-acetyltransferase n=1 Tax=Psychrobacillus sp. PGGUH221 TaxID=3020058 RepID=UPI0035C6BEF9
MKVKIVQTKEELDTVFDIRIKVFVHEQLVPMEEEIDEYENDSVHFLLYDGENSIGTGRFRIVNGIGKVERICVLSDKRKRGSGKCIMQGIEEYAIRQNINKLMLHGQTHAEKFYIHLGYKTVSDVFFEAGIPHVVMEKEII